MGVTAWVKVHSEVLWESGVAPGSAKLRPEIFRRGKSQLLDYDNVGNLSSG